MNNKILYVTKDEANIIKRNAIENENVFFAEIYGDRINTEEDYVKEMSNAFIFPHELPEMKIGWYNDYICDLLWIEHKEIILLIHNFNYMLADDMKTKKNILADFEEIILPWWEKDVVGHMVGGNSKSFLVFIEN